MCLFIYLGNFCSKYNYLQNKLPHTKYKYYAKLILFIYLLTNNINFPIIIIQFVFFYCILNTKKYSVKPKI